MPQFAAFPLTLVLLAATDLPASVEVEVTGLRNSKGVVHACLTRDPRHFPDCARDPAALRQTVPATTRHLRFSDLAAGRYAVTLIHDENTNHRLDKLLGLPREGFGFSRNPAIRFGPPRFEQVVITVGQSITQTSVRMQYLL
jgi:uncharacterized protein (DUF2141 family)